jgi:membrane protease YdiL (CAAX protease family)
VSRREDEGLSAFVAICLFALTLALMLGSRLGISALYALFADRPLAEAARSTGGSLPILTLIQLFAMGTAVSAGLKLRDDELSWSDALHLHPPHLASLALCLVAGVCLQFPLAELGNLLHQHVFGMEPLELQLARQALIEAHGPIQGAGVVLSLVALVPFAEEALFRGLFLFGLSERYGRGFGLLLSSALFGLVHLDVVAAVYAAAAGLVLGSLALATQSIWASVAVHAAVNAVPVLVPESVWPIHGLNVPSEQPQHLPAWLVLPALALAIGLLLTVQRIEAKSVSHD